MAPFPGPTKRWHDTAQPTTLPRRPELSAAGKTIVITGGGTGIGAETARRFAEANAARIVLLGRRKQPLLDTKADIEQKFPETEVLVESVDVTKKVEVDTAFNQLLGENKIDVVVSNAGMTGPTDILSKVDPDRFMEAVDQNVRGALYIAQAFLRYAAPTAVAINVSSSAAHVDFGAGFACYNTAKLAAFRLWDCLGFANSNISVFHIQPGVVDTDMNRANGGVAAVGFEDHVSLPGCFNVWLASAEARFLRGKFLWTNWDVDELKERAAELQGSPELTIGLVGWPFGDSKWTSMWKDPE